MNLGSGLNQWRDRFFDTTRGKIVLLVRQGEQTVNDLAERLNLTDNAVRSHLAALERDALIERAGERRGGGKPSITYQVSSEGEKLFPKAYSLVLSNLLATIAESFDEKTREELLATTGRRLAAGVELSPEAPLSERLEIAAQVLTDIGGLADIQERDGAYVIQGKSCPLLETAEVNPDACFLAASLVEALIERPVTICCQREGRPRCCFAVESPDELAAAGD